MTVAKVYSRYDGLNEAAKESRFSNRCTAGALKTTFYTQSLTNGTKGAQQACGESGGMSTKMPFAWIPLPPPVSIHQSPILENDSNDS